MAKLAEIDLPDVEKASATSAVPVAELATPEGDVVKRYNAAYAACKAAEREMEALEPTLTDYGLNYIFEHNCANGADPKKIISSVKLVDRLVDDNGKPVEKPETCMVVWSRKDLKNDADKVQAAFRLLRTTEGKTPNINNYVGYLPKADFDVSIFMVDGAFDKDRYTDVMDALAKVAKRYGLANPLTVNRVLKPRPDFHASRWVMFDVATNLKLQKVLPTQTNLKPVREAAKK